VPNSLLPKLFSTATQFLEQQSIATATHIALLDKEKVVVKRKYLYLLLNIILQKLDLFLITRRAQLVRLFPVTADDGIDVHVNASYNSFRRKEFDNCSLFRNLVFIPTIAENPT
jgi:hypothetical protein